MTNRREFLQVGLAASALPLNVQSATGALAGTNTVPLYKVVYDTRFADSVAFARRSHALGLAVQAIDGDMTRFWYDDLYHRWQRTPAAIAGLTAHGAMFCLERLAWDQGMRVVFRAEHRLAPDAVAHELSGPEAMLQDARTSVCTRAWGAAVADVVASCPSARAEIVTAAVRGPASGELTHDGEPLYSWVIAPVSRA